MMATEDRLDRHRRRLSRAAFGMGEITAADLAAELGTAGPAADPGAIFDAAAARGLGPTEALVLIAIAHFAKSGTAAPPSAVAAALHAGEPIVVQVIVGLLRRSLLVNATADVGVGVVPAFTVTAAGATLAAEIEAAS